jgi:hypothetical protein
MFMSINRRYFAQVAAGIGAASVLARADDHGHDNDDNGNNENDNDKDDQRHMPDNTSGDTAQQIFNVGLIADDLSTVFYFNGLTQPGVIESADMSGPGGSATNVKTDNADRVGYFRAALAEEIEHANLFRQLTGRTSPSMDPVQMFFFPTNTFNSFDAFIQLLLQLEDAAVGITMTAVQEFAQMAADTKARAASQMDFSGRKYTSTQLELFAKVAASLVGVEAEHRALGRDAAEAIPANNVCFEQNDGILSIFHGKNSALAVLQPFLTPGPGKTGFMLKPALAGAPAIVLPCTGNPPS